MSNVNLALNDAWRLTAALKKAKQLHLELRADLETSREQMALGAWKDMNPRVVLWLQAHGLPVVVTARVDGEVGRVTIAGHENLWTVHYMGWINRMWTAWGTSLGYREARDALRDGHTNFDAWLDARVTNEVLSKYPTKE